MDVSNQIKLDQSGSNWIKKDQELDQIRICQNLGVGAWRGLVPCHILCLFIFDYWETWLNLVMLEHAQACLKQVYDTSAVSD